MKKNILLIGGCGYIGSHIYRSIPTDLFNIEVCDLIKRGNKLNIDVLNKNYKDLEKEYLKKFSAVIWFAGHSSVSQSIIDPINAIKNNCIDLFDLALKLHKDTKLIYASSASLYSSKKLLIRPANENELIHIPEENSYDASKFAFDYIAKNFLKNFYGLRMGTLCGYSPNIREELVFNSMNISAYKNNHIKLMNSKSWRSILFLEDLSRFVNKLITSDIEPGFYNLCSSTLTMHDLAEKISSFWNVPIINQGDSSTYSFKIDNSKMLKVISINTTNDYFNQQCANLIEGIKNEK